MPSYFRARRLPLADPIAAIDDQRQFLRRDSLPTVLDHD